MKTTEGETMRIKTVANRSRTTEVQQLVTGFLANDPGTSPLYLVVNADGSMIPRLDERGRANSRIRERKSAALRLANLRGGYIIDLRTGEDAS